MANGENISDNPHEWDSEDEEEEEEDEEEDEEE